MKNNIKTAPIFKSVLLCGSLLLSSLTLTSCKNGEEKPSGTYESNFYISGWTTQDQKHKIDIDGKKATLENVWFGNYAGLVNGTATVTDWEKYDWGIYYWIAEVSCSITTKEGYENDWSQYGYANKSSSWVYTAGYFYNK